MGLYYLTEEVEKTTIPIKNVLPYTVIVFCRILSYN